MGKLEPQKHGGALYRPAKGETPNPNGVPKGTKHLSTWIQQLLNDDKFINKMHDGEKIVEHKGAPIKAIIQAQMIKALQGDVKAFDALAKYGYGSKLDVTSNGETLKTALVEFVDAKTDVDEEE